MLMIRWIPALFRFGLLWFIVNGHFIGTSSDCCSIETRSEWGNWKKEKIHFHFFQRHYEFLFRSAGGQTWGELNSHIRAKLKYQLQFGSCEYANSNFKGAADCIKWFDSMNFSSNLPCYRYRRNGLMFELYYETLLVQSYTQGPSYTVSVVCYGNMLWSIQETQRSCHKLIRVHFSNQYSVCSS